MGEWISVEDRLPDENIDVLVLAKSGWMGVRFYRLDDGVHAWGWYPGGLPIGNSSHWMPLPDPPG